MSHEDEDEHDDEKEYARAHPLQARAGVRKKLRRSN
jgi:hypothetical protein